MCVYHSTCVPVTSLIRMICKKWKPDKILITCNSTFPLVPQHTAEWWVVQCLLGRYLAGYGRTRHQGHDRAEESGERDIIHTSHTLPRDRGGGHQDREDESELILYGITLPLVFSFSPNIGWPGRGYGTLQEQRGIWVSPPYSNKFLFDIFICLNKFFYSHLIFNITRYLKIIYA